MTCLNMLYANPSAIARILQVQALFNQSYKLNIVRYLHLSIFALLKVFLISFINYNSMGLIQAAIALVHSGLRGSDIF